MKLTVVGSYPQLPRIRSWRDKKEGLGKIGEDVLEGNKRQFKTRGARMHGRRWKKKADGTPATLVLTKRLRTASTRKKARNGRLTVRGNRMQFKVSVPYFKYHQEGTKYMPQRIVGFILDSQRKRWLKIVGSMFTVGDRGK